MSAGTTSAPPVRTARSRRLAAWGAIAAGLILLGLVAAVIADAARWSERAVLDPESVGPEGARALARVLEEQGVDVRVVRDAASARAAVGPGTTLVLPEAVGLADDQITDLADAAGTVVLVEPRSALLDLLLPGSTSVSSSGADPVELDCPPAGLAQRIVVGETYAPGPGVEGCAAVDDGYALLRDTDGERVTWAVDGRSLLVNEAIGQADNAALALTLLGEHPTLVWYAPSLAEAAGRGAPTLGQLTPRWVSPVAVLLIAAAAVAAIWRGRRFGPLVAENLPVTVRASETTTGRGRLYANSRDTAHAYDQLRRAARRRLAAQLGLAAHTSAREIADAVAGRLGVERRGVHDILVDASPADDRALVDLDHRLSELEARVRAAVRPGTASPEGHRP